MKKIFTILFTVVMLLTFCLPAYASDDALYTEIEYFDNGSYIITTLTKCTSSVSAYATSTITGRRTSNYYNEDNEHLWGVTLVGTFSYNGSSASCIDATMTYSISDSNWRITSINAIESGNTARGEATCKKYVLGVPIQTVEKILEISCSPTGVLS